MSSPACWISWRACSTSWCTSAPGSVAFSSSDEQARERRPELVRDGGGEARAELLVGGEGRDGGEEEDERARLDLEGLLTDPPPRSDVPEGGGGGRARRHEAALAVEDDDRLRQRGQKRSRPFELAVHHAFTSLSPFIDPSEAAGPR